jgi:hypothetical protein
MRQNPARHMKQITAAITELEHQWAAAAAIYAPTATAGTPADPWAAYQESRARSRP